MGKTNLAQRVSVRCKLLSLNTIQVVAIDYDTNDIFELQWNFRLPLVDGSAVKVLCVDEAGKLKDASKIAKLTFDSAVDLLSQSFDAVGVKISVPKADKTVSDAADDDSNESEVKSSD